MSLIDLPEEMLHRIAEYLDVAALAAMACAHPRLHCVGEYYPLELIDRKSIHEPLITFLSISGARVRCLNLSDCWTSSVTMRMLIEQCSNLMELDVLNSSLTDEDLLDALENLKHLKSLSATIAEVSADCVFGFYPSIRRVYIEFPPDHEAMNWVARFLDVCPSVKNLHVNVVGIAKTRISDRTLDISAARLNGFEKMVFSRDPQSSRSCLLCHVFNRDVSLPHYELLQRFSEDIYWFERRPQFEAASDEGDEWPALHPPSYERVDLDDVEDLGEFPWEFGEGQVGARVTGSSIPFAVPSMAGLSPLLELDFTGCHYLYSSASWWTLVRASPTVEALAVPACSLFTHEPDYLPTMNEGTVKALRNLNLRALHVESVREGCTKCWAEFSGVFSKYLNDFSRLRELTMRSVQMSGDFFSSLEAPCTLETLKLKLRYVKDLKGLKRFFHHCSRLRVFTLETPGLSLDSIQLWDALGGIRLKQLCLASNSEERIRIQTLAPRLPDLLRDLDVLHLHSKHVANVEELRALVENEVRRADAVRMNNPVRYLDVRLSISDMRHAAVPKFPGRNLCCLERSFARPTA